MTLYDILTSDNVVESIETHMDDLLVMIPEIQNMVNFPHNHPHHHLDVWRHTLYALSLSSNDFDIRLSLLLHDIGKPFSYQDEEVRHFRGHPNVSSSMAKVILKRIGFDDSYTKRICFFIENHDTPMSDEFIKNNIDLCLPLFEIQRCDALAHHPDKLEKRKEYLENTKKKILLKTSNKKD